MTKRTLKQKLWLEEEYDWSMKSHLIVHKVHNDKCLFILRKWIYIDLYVYLLSPVSMKKLTSWPEVICWLWPCIFSKWLLSMTVGHIQACTGSQVSQGSLQGPLRPWWAGRQREVGLNIEAFHIRKPKST